MRDHVADAASELDYLAVLHAIQQAGIAAGHWQGVPMPIKDLTLHVQERHPHRDALEAMGKQFDLDLDDAAVAAARAAGEEVVPTGAFRSMWYSRVRQCHVYIYDAGDPPKARLWVLPQERSGRAMKMALNTLQASRVWDTEAEWTAMEKLQGLVSGPAWRYYILTGTFLETSRRSRVTYFFRKLRPTLALRPGPDGMMRALCALCMHPLAYYGDSWAGAMVPTDDVIAHLLFMRGDEPRYWRYANQHDPESLSAGLVS